MKKTFYWLLVAVTLSTACQDDNIYQHYIKIPNQVWSQYNKVYFKVKITAPIQAANVYLAVRYNPVLPYESLKLNVRTITPSKLSQTNIYTFPLHKITDSNYSGFQTLADKNNILATNISFLEKGTYYYEVQHLMKVNQLPLIEDVGLIVKKFANQP